MFLIINTREELILVLIKIYLYEKIIEMFYYKKYISLTLFIITFLVLNNTAMAQQAPAQEAPIYCGNTNIVWKDYSFTSGGASSDDLIAQPLSTNFGVSSSIWTWGSFPQSSEKCMANLVQKAAKDNGEELEIDPSCEMTPEEEARCTGIQTMDVEASSNTNRLSNRNHGLVGVAYTLEQGLEDPIPLNMAYFMKRNAQKIPIINKTAYANTGPEYSGPMLGVIYNYWTITRNIAYALMAIILLVIGIMIITQRKLDAKSALTVQQAIPQIIISIILIYVSYPIGATGASLAYGLLNSAAAWSITILNLKEVSIPQVTAATGVSIWESLGSQIISWIMSNLTSLVAAVYYLIVLLKIFGIYLKMILGVVSAPLIFAVGAIPGQQKNVINWFKQFGANIVAIPITLIAFEIVKNVSYELTSEIFINYDSFAESYRGNMLGGYVIFIIPAISFMGMGLVTKIPAQIEKIFGLSK